MTIEEAIRELEEDKAMYMPREWIEELDRDTPDGRLITALEMAIKSLEAWEKVKEEINELSELNHIGDHFDDCKLDVLKIINKHLKEVEKNQRENCPYRHENGNCLPIGGFCLSVSDKECKHLKEVENDS